MFSETRTTEIILICNTKNLNSKSDAERTHAHEGGCAANWKRTAARVFRMIYL